ncbi:hypothetical protein WA026_006798 [Henosepilachna vigintioctopunctata]|uniref:Uncharacterized protein n=1 Tax=Henosepilachna vigintioctopunctata TaxID=420089 RepID=A0AAW1UGZ2_9CUCU
MPTFTIRLFIRHQLTNSLTMHSHASRSSSGFLPETTTDKSSAYSVTKNRNNFAGRSFINNIEVRA